MNPIVKILMERDGMDRKEAEMLLAEMQVRVFEGEDPADVLQEEAGLEPDYMDDLI